MASSVATRWTWSQAQRLAPQEGWLVLALTLGALAVVAGSVEAASWVRTPSLVATILLAGLAGLATAKVRGWAPAKHAVALLVGAAFVYWSTATLVEARGSPEMFVELNARLSRWWEAAVGGGISSDTVPFALGLGVLTWLAGYVTAWGVFHRRNLWLGILPGTIAITTNLSYLPDSFLGFLFLYLAINMLLAVRMYTLEQERGWGSQGTGFPRLYGFAVLHGAAWFIGAVVLVGVLLPVRPVVAADFKEAWNTIRWPAARAEDQFARLFSSLPARKPLRARSFGPYLPFQGPISLGKHTVFFVRSSTPAYWRSRVYPVYTSQGWKTGAAETYRLDEPGPVGVVRDDRDTTDVEYGVNLPTPAGPIPMNALLLEVSIPVQIEVRTAQRYPLSLERLAPAPGVPPPDLRLAALNLMEARDRFGTPLESSALLLQMLPWDTLVTEVLFREPGGSRRRISVAPASLVDHHAALEEAMDKGRGSLVGLQVIRAPPSPPDILAVRGMGKIDGGLQYTAVSRESISPGDELRDAGTGYPSWVTDAYLQLPDSLPMRVRDLARDLTAGASTPYDQALAIRDYLKEVRYDQKIDPPPFDADGVDYFLFTARRGYSEYYASAMAVMLRSLGVPARLVAGHSSGVLDEASGLWVIRDLDSHAWPEVYFPGYGWVELEPTPGFGLPASGTGPDDLSLLAGGADLADDDEDDEDLLDLLATGLPLTQQKGSPLGRPVVLGGFAVGMALLLALAAGWYLYWRILVRPPGAREAFEGMCRLAGLAGIGPNDALTPRQYTSYLGGLFPAVQVEVTLLGEVYGRVRYGFAGDRELSSQEEGRIFRAWRRVRRLLFLQALRRFALFWRMAG